MNPLKDNEDVACFVVTKLSWKGKYKRIFSIGTMGISTYSPNKLEVTNQWLYSDFISITPTSKGQTTEEFTINMKKGRKSESMKFASELRAEILTEALRFRNKFAESAFVTTSYRASKLHWSDNPLPVVLNLVQLQYCDEAITSVSDFIVHKESRRYSEPVKRILGLTETCLIERDPQTYSIVTIRPLNSIYALIRHPDNPQKFRVEYVTGQIRSYTSSDRDALLATLLDGVRASGNCDVHVKMHTRPTCRGQRFGPFYLPVDEEVETNHLRFLVSLPVRWDFSRAVIQFNNNISYKGLVHATLQESKEKFIQPALIALLERDGDSEQPSEMLEAQFQCIRRLVASKMGFATFTQIPSFREKLGLKVVRALKHGDAGVAHASIDMLCALMQIII
ncbi:dnaJ homolog subfamily C member 13 [Caerostris extrusa]|uniref:DnaJ homolog subfamily C member 13 n=1 Tax=Caerostris extrusa TaxID=172846 RepID=A0AAV4VG76_CAEEX|nr:dnaJ homolog subfamily C member 13 [Caerostris extrusa]